MNPDYTNIEVELEDAVFCRLEYIAGKMRCMPEELVVRCVEHYISDHPGPPGMSDAERRPSRNFP